MHYKIEPWAHQLKTIENASPRDYYGLFFEMGGGKTSTVINILRKKMNDRKRSLSVLVLCPVIVVENWKREFLAHSMIPPKNILTLSGPGKKRLKALDGTPEPWIVVTNIEAISMKALWERLKECDFDVVIIDESHRFKNPQAKRTRELHKWLDSPRAPRYRYILTGSPILNSPLDIWAQMYILNRSILGPNFFSFRASYFYDANANMPPHVHFPNWKIRPGAEEALNGIIYEHADRVLKKDALDLPPITYQTIPVPLSSTQAKLYKQMRDDFVAWLDEETAMVADLALTKALRLQQLVSGIFVDDKGAASEIENERNKILEEVLEDLNLNGSDNKVIIWAVFKLSYEQIKKTCEKLELNYVMLTGAQSYGEKVEAVDAFNTDPSVKIIIANQGAGGTGVNLTAANYAIYYSRNINLEHDLQSEARNHRGGQTRKVTRIDLVAPATIDEIAAEALKGKEKMAEAILKLRG